MRNLAPTFFCIFCMILVLTISCLADIITFPDDNHHHQHNHDHDQSTITERGSQHEISSNEIPLDVIFRLNDIQDFSELNNFLNQDSLDAAGIKFEDLNSTIINRLGDSNDDERDSKGPVIPKYAKCIPELTTVPLMRPGNGTNLVFYPSCTRVERCGGCCSHDLLSCQPTLKVQLDYQVIVTEYVGKDKFNYKSKEIVSVEQHLKCKCDCKVKQTDCTRFQDYREGECRCVCRNLDDERKCIAENDTKIWDPKNCVCSCRDTKECSTDYFFNQETCSCTEIPRRRRAGATPVNSRIQKEETVSSQISYPLPVVPYIQRNVRQLRET